VAGKTNQLAGEGAWGGLMDAGDWDSRAQHLIVTRYLLELAEIAPAFFNQVNLDTPESKNALPDVIDEALFNLDHYRRLQTPEGGIRGGVEQEEHPRYGEASWQNSLETLVYAPDPWSSYLYAAAAARAAFVLERFQAQEAAAYRESALRALRWAEANRVPGKFAEPVRDARALASAEMFRTTGDVAWQRIFAETHRAGTADLGGEEARDSLWAYITTRQPGIDQALQKGCRNAYLATAFNRAAGVELTAFHGSGETSGWGFLSPDNVILARAHQLTGEARYLHALLLASQLRAGANPLNLCYTTGLGLRTVRRPLHVDSEYSGQAPPPGITVMGNVDQVRSWEKIFELPVQIFFTPARPSWPALETYWEDFWYPPMAEYTVQHPMAAIAYTRGYLAAREASTPDSQK
jgi:endoglucanase